ncbi:hypothetical protein V6N13_123145 [Hibiscus sabdariffa]
MVCRSAFDGIAIASSIEDAKSEIFICGWWLCPELYLRRPFHEQASSRLDALLEAKAKQGVQAEVGSVCFQSSLSTHDYTFIKTYQASTKSNSNAMITNANSTFLQIMTGGKLLLLVKRRN